MTSYRIIDASSDACIRGAEAPEAAVLLCVPAELGKDKIAQHMQGYDVAMPVLLPANASTTAQLSQLAKLLGERPIWLHADSAKTVYDLPVLVRQMPSDTVQTIYFDKSAFQADLGSTAGEHIAYAEQELQQVADILGASMTSDEGAA